MKTLLLVLSSVAFAQELTVPASIHPELRAHTDLFEKKFYRVGNVHCAVGYGMANILFVEGENGVVVIDTGMDVEQARAVLADFRKISQKPIAAIVLTHHHADHVQGTAAFTTAEDVKSGKMPVYAHESLVAAYQQENITAGPIMRMRALAMYNVALTGPDRDGMNSGIGPLFRYGTFAFLPPNKLVRDRLDVTIAGVEMRIVHVPSEAASEIAIYLPQTRTLLSAEVIQDHTFPNIYTLRGAVYRDPLEWVRSIDKLRAFGAEDMVLQHGPPVRGKAEVETVLRNYRDAIQYVRDQTVRWMNHGLAKDEIARKVQLPPHLERFSPWLREFYGSVSHAVPSIYDGNIGWFEGDPVVLQATPRVEYAKRTVKMMGGREKVLAEARSAFASGDVQFAAELATLLIRIDNNDMDARRLKAAAFRKQGYATINSTWRGLYLTLANTLDGKMDWSPILAANRSRYSSAAMAESMPARMMLDVLPGRLKAEAALDVEQVVGFRFTDTGEALTVSIRRGIAEVREGEAAAGTLTINGTRAAMARALADGGATLPESLQVTGSRDAAQRFLALFEPAFGGVPDFYLR